MSRAQYNVVYNEVLRYLNDIERTTGVRPPVVYLETGAVAIEPGGAVRRNFYNAEVYVGWYRKRKVGKRERGGWLRGCSCPPRSLLNV